MHRCWWGSLQYMGHQCGVAHQNSKIPRQKRGGFHECHVFRMTCLSLVELSVGNVSVGKGKGAGGGGGSS